MRDDELASGQYEIAGTTKELESAIIAIWKLLVNTVMNPESQDFALEHLENAMEVLSITIPNHPDEEEESDL